jgi:hypothetical protein
MNTLSIRRLETLAWALKYGRGRSKPIAVIRSWLLTKSVIECRALLRHPAVYVHLPRARSRVARFGHKAITCGG